MPEASLPSPYRASHWAAGNHRADPEQTVTEDHKLRIALGEVLAPGIPLPQPSSVLGASRKHGFYAAGF